MVATTSEDILSSGMANLSPGARARIADLSSLIDKVHRAHSLVEQYAAAKVNPEQFLLPLSRQLTQLKMQFMAAGFDAMSQLAGSMEIAARRGLSPTAKVRVLREGIGSLKFQVELAQRAIVDEAKEAERQVKPAGRGDGEEST
jgi:hypothetical protein